MRQMMDHWYSEYTFPSLSPTLDGDTAHSEPGNPAALLVVVYCDRAQARQRP